MTVFFYTRPQCVLCEEGYQTLKLVQQDIGFQIKIVNIEEDNHLHEQFALMIPVVQREKQVVQYGQLDYVTLYEALVK